MVTSLVATLEQGGNMAKRLVDFYPDVKDAKEPKRQQTNQELAQLRKMLDEIVKRTRNEYSQ